jgi:hypothetical protein
MPKKDTKKRWSKNKKGGSRLSSKKSNTTNRKRVHIPTPAEVRNAVILLPSKDSDSDISNASPISDEVKEQIEQKYNEIINKQKAKTTDPAIFNMIEGAKRDELAEKYQEKNKEKKKKREEKKTKREKYFEEFNKNILKIQEEDLAAYKQDPENYVEEKRAENYKKGIINEMGPLKTADINHIYTTMHHPKHIGKPKSPQVNMYRKNILNKWRNPEIVLPENIELKKDKTPSPENIAPLSIPIQPVPIINTPTRKNIFRRASHKVSKRMVEMSRRIKKFFGR